MNPSSLNKKSLRDEAMKESIGAMPFQMSGSDIPNSSLDLLEQHQAREQARLLQRFRELREWQQQQQQQLMQQQQQQLRTWQDEQSKVQTLIANQGGKGIKPTKGSIRSPLMTPPTKPRPEQTATSLMVDSISQSQIAGVSLDSGLVVSMQDTLKSQSSLPKPVMYPSLTSTLNKDNDDDKYTNSELFSNLGSHEELQERAQELEEEKPCADWMSDSSENFLRGSQLPPPRPVRGNNQLAGLEQLLKTAPAGLLQQMLGLLPVGKDLEAQVRGGRGSEDVELSASPTLPTSSSQQQPAARRLLSYQNSDRDESPELRNDGGSPVLEAQQVQQSRQLLQQQQQMLLIMQQKQEQIRHSQNQQQGLQQQMQMSQQLYPKNRLLLGPSVSELDVDPRFIPRAVSLEGSEVMHPQLDNGTYKQGHRQGTFKDEEDEEQDGNSSENELEEGDVSEDEEESKELCSKPTRDEDRPISGTGGKKTFEQLLEEQLQQEQEEKERRQQESIGSCSAQRKIPFLKKGEGIARFNSAPKKPAPKKKSSSRSQTRPHQPTVAQANAGGESSQARNIEDGGRKATVAARLKNMGKPAESAENSFGAKKGFVRKVQPNQGSQGERPVAKLSLIRSVANKKLEEQQKQMQQEQSVQQQQQQQLLQKQLVQQLQNQRDEESEGRPFFRDGPRRLGDLSTILEQSPSLDGRSNMTEDHDSTELDSLAEFEALEEAADNMSLCSSSSLVGRLVYGDKQGQKEAVRKLKTITESLKSARGEGSTFGLEETKVEAGPASARMNNNNNNNNNNDINSNRQNSREEAVVAMSNLSAEKQDEGSSDVTLTDSSDDECVDDNKNNYHSQLANGVMNSGNSSDQTRPQTAASTESQAPPASPLKMLTRKVAPLSSKFSEASDTLSLLKSLSAQANILTSVSPQGSPLPDAPSQKNAISSTTSAQDVPPHAASKAAQSQSIDFFSGMQTLPPNFFSAAAKDGLMLSSTFGPSIAQTFQASSSIAVPSSSSTGFKAFAPFTKINSGESQPFALNGISTVNEYQGQKYKDGNSDRESDSDDEDNESDSTEDNSDQNEDNGEKKNGISDTRQENEHQKSEQDEGKAEETGHGLGFDDESAWEDGDDEDAFDNATTLKTASSGSASSAAAAVGQSNGEPSTPPTSRLVSRLFPKLKPKPSVENTQKQQCLQEASAQPVNSGTGVQSSILREKLKELDSEIERFRSENSNLEKLRREREEGLAKLKQEIENFQREKENELKRLEEFKAEEMKKLKRERKLFESYQKKLRSMPDKKEREEIENLKMQLQEVQEELKRKESRWTASTARLKNRVAELELENGEVKEEVRILERKRLEWMTSQGMAERNAGHASNGKVGGPSSIGGGSAERVSGQAGPRSSTPTGESSQQMTYAQHKDIGRQGSSMSTKVTMPAVSSALSNGGSNYSNSNNNINRSKGNKAAASGNNNNHNTQRNAGPSGVSGGSQAKGGSASNPTVSASHHTHKGVPCSNGTTSVVAPSIPVTKLALATQQQQQQNGRSSKDSVEWPQTLQNTAVPVMMECTIPSGTEVSTMPGLQTDQPSPVKSAAKQAMEKAVVDKGDPAVFTENLHQDGKLEKTFRTGAKEILFPNGTLKEISADGQTIICRLANGDIRQIFPDHRVVYIFSEPEIMQTTFPDGMETFQFQNGQVERRYPDGTVEITFPSKDIKYMFPDGGQEVILTDGTVMQYNSQGERTVEYPSGDREVHTAEFQRREFPDGIIKTIYADGRHETRFPNGRVRMRDKDGNVIMDQIVYR
ncbi:centromere protein j [Plakobranchus ocellatus]|uniref:Centromere protein j n=1 Tax=Plakobranchus ocellatus TaxID=259542 RepID=A0AAV3Y2F9_9GAST|nr:centromere protein j [Plakobranchus ocellatus]